MDIIIRKAEKKDCQGILSLIKTLAEQHNASDMINYSEKELQKWGFEQQKPLFEAFVAEKNGKIEGCVVYFERFSTWKGPTFHIEDLIVSPLLRGQKIGDKLFNCVVEEAKKRSMNRIELDVEEDNIGAIKFYQNKGMNCKGWLSAKFYL